MDTRKAKPGDTVSVHYAGKLADGLVFDTSTERDPIEVTIGAGQVIGGFDNALVDMAEGETKTFTIEADEAYGQHDPRLVHVVGREQLPPELDLSVGAQVQATDPGGNQVRLTVAELSDDNVTLDANHPLAGHNLTFDVTLVEFVD